jgi:uncharacterized protein YjbJ (UPF0337 family)
MKVGNIKLEHMRGFADKGVGLGKELIGTVVGNRRLEEEGEAQQARATEHLKALRKEAEAQRHEAAAEAHEQRQRTAQRAKERAAS